MTATFFGKAMDNHFRFRPFNKLYLIEFLATTPEEKDFGLAVVFTLLICD